MFGFSLIIFDIFRDELSHLEASGWPSQRGPLGGPLGLFEALWGTLESLLEAFGGPFEAFGGLWRGPWGLLERLWRLFSRF